MQRRVKQQNDVNPADQTTEAEKKFKISQSEQHPNKASQRDNKNMREMRKRPVSGYYAKQNADGWAEVRSKFCAYCNRIGHLEENCRKKRVEDERRRTAEEKEQRLMGRHQIHPKIVPCSVCGRIGHTTCWIAHLELRHQQAPPYSGFNNREIKFFNVSTKNWSHHMVSNMPRGDFSRSHHSFVIIRAAH